MELLNQLSTAAGIPLKVNNKELDLSTFLSELYEIGHVTEELYLKIESVIGK